MIQDRKPQLEKEPLKRIGVIGDIHCEDQRLAVALRFFSNHQLDLICAVGDIVDGPGDPNRTIELLAKHQIVCVRGNHERWFLANEMRNIEDATSRVEMETKWIDLLAKLPLIRRFESSAGRVMLCHGLGLDDLGSVWPMDQGFALHRNRSLWKVVNSDECDFLINGHTHQRMVRKIDGLTIINTGTLYRRQPACLTIIDFEQRFVQFYAMHDDNSIEKDERIELYLNQKNKIDN